MIKRLLFLFCLLLMNSFLFSQKIPKIGVTLSGGGAKGLAHIGILKAIDSAGLKVDYITGTSMGSIIGSLYAIGYSADSIETLVRDINWDLILSNQSTYKDIFMEEKSEYGKYNIEVPWEEKKLKLASGLLESQELWLKLSELYFPVTFTKDFSAFNIPFKAVTTDLSNGNAVVQQDGEIISAVRASMAIPSVFTAIEKDGKKLVDGGISRNFPVRDVKEMGADYVIGSSVATGLLPSHKVVNPIQILLQIAFFKEAEDAKNEIPLVDEYIHFTMDQFNMGSFSEASKILDVGIARGRELYPKFKQLADSLKAINPNYTFKKDRLPKLDSVLITEVEVTGLKHTGKSFLTNTMDLSTGEYYTPQKLADMIRQAFGTRYYARIVYSIEPVPAGNKITLNVIENPLTYIKAGIHYNGFSGIGVITNFTSRNLLLPNSRTMAAINLGDNLRIRGEHLQYLGRSKKVAATILAQYDRMSISYYDNLKAAGLYKHHLSVFSQRLHYSPSRNFSIGIGNRFEEISYKPRITNGISIKGKNNFPTHFAYIKVNTLDRTVLSKKGVLLEAEIGQVRKQRLSIDVLDIDENNPGFDTLQVAQNPYTRASLNLEIYSRLNSNYVWINQIQSGTNFNYENHAMNEFIIGGLTKQFRNQVTFAGLPEGSFFTSSYASYRTAFRRSLFTGASVTAQANILLNNFLSKSNFFEGRDFYSGYALTFSYNFALGPLEISAMYGDQIKKFSGYINLGIPF